MKKSSLLFLFTLLFLLLGSQSYSQKKKKANRHLDKSPKQELVYDNKNYVSSIASVQLYPVDQESGFPIINLNTDDQLILKFDDLRADIRDLYMSLEYCDADWKPSRVSRIDYAEGYNEDRIVDIRSSISTLQSYTHYQAVFPNEYMAPKMAGNYILKVYEDADKNRLLLTRKFYVLKNILPISSKIGPSPIVSNRNSNQKIDLTLSTASLSIQNPQRDLNIQVFQNKREDYILTTNTPSYIGANEIKFELMNSLDFLGNNEFRYVDLRSFRLGSEHVRKISSDSTTQIVIYPDLDLSMEKYASTFDENGAFYIRNLDQNDDDLEGDYADVYFSLKTDTERAGSVHLVGSFNNFKADSNNQLTYDQDNGSYGINMKLKQGLYDYEYIYKTPDGLIITDRFSGSHFETNNDYQILIYNRRPGTYWDELVGYKELGINERN